MDGSLHFRSTQSISVDPNSVEFLFVVTYRKLRSFLADFCHILDPQTGYPRQGIFRVRPRLKLLMFLVLLEIVNIFSSVFLAGGFSGMFTHQSSPISRSLADRRQHYIQHLLRHGTPKATLLKPTELNVTKSTQTPIEVKEHIHPHDFNLVLDEPSICFDEKGALKEVFLVVLITTTHENAAKRQAIRDTWGSPRDINGRNIITMFLLASTRATHLQERVEEESRLHHDLIQEDFTDSYKNLTLKTIMGLKWVSTHCSHASYVMKTDDDMYVSYHNLVKYLDSNSTRSSQLAFGYLINGNPIRDPSSKWYMPKSLYSENTYPPFLSGTGYVMSRDVAVAVYRQSLDTKFLYLEDVFFAICLKKQHMRPMHNANFYNWRINLQYSSCRFYNLITVHMVTPETMHKMWDQHKQIRLSGSKCKL